MRKCFEIVPTYYAGAGIHVAVFIEAVLEDIKKPSKLVFNDKVVDVNPGDTLEIVGKRWADG